jgi:thioredoxin 1
METGYGPNPTREEVDREAGPLLLNFGADWCGHCQALAPGLAALLVEFPQVRQVKAEDGPGRPLGRSFRVKLWPNLVFLRNGTVVRQLARPGLDEVRAALEELTADA